MPTAIMTTILNWNEKFAEFLYLSRNDQHIAFNCTVIAYSNLQGVTQKSQKSRDSISFDVQQLQNLAQGNKLRDMGTSLTDYRRLQKVRI